VFDLCLKLWMLECDSLCWEGSQCRDGFLFCNSVTTGFALFLCPENQPIGDVSELAGPTGIEPKWIQVH
jgi:hypothetical protein